MHYLGLCAIAKNETPYLREWVAHHYLLGFERFLIYDNESDEPVRVTLADYVEQGIVETVLVTGQSAQLPAYQNCLERWRGKVRWAAFFDLDEFLVLKQHKDARLLLLDYEEFGGLGINWVMYGSSGHMQRPEGLVTEQYTRSLPDNAADIHIKSIVRPDVCTGFRNVHQATFIDGFYAVNEFKLPIVSALTPPSRELAQLNHYFYKSQEDYALKLERGRADVAELTADTRSWRDFYDQAQEAGQSAPLSPHHVKLLKLALRSHSLQRYVDVDSHEVAGLELFQIIERMSAADVDTATLLLELARPRYGHAPEFLARAVMLYMDSGNFEHAMRDVGGLIRARPDVDSFYLLFLLHLAMGRADRAREVARYLKSAAQTFDCADHESMRKLKEADKRLQLGVF